MHAEFKSRQIRWYAILCLKYLVNFVSRLNDSSFDYASWVNSEKKNVGFFFAAVHCFLNKFRERPFLVFSIVNSISNFQIIS